MIDSTAENCIRHESTYRGASVYTVVVMDGECPREVSVSLSFPAEFSFSSRESIENDFSLVAEDANYWLGMENETREFAISMTIACRCETDLIIADALIAAMEGR